MSTNETQTIPEIIQNQLFSINKNKVKNWNPHNWIGTDNTLIFNILNCNQLKKGTIHISLNGKDLYDIKVFNEHYELFANIENIYFDMLISTIENIINI